MQRPPRPGHETVNASRCNEAIRLQAIMLEWGRLAAAKYGSFLFSPETARYYHRPFAAT